MLKEKGIVNVKDNKSLLGGVGVTLAYTMWGVLTVFWNLLSGVNPVYILAHRIVWSMVFMIVYIAVVKRLGEIKAIFRNKKSLLLCFACGVLVTINWGVYIYAVNSAHVLDASLGYFIEPVLVALIGVIAFKEKMSFLEKLTFGFAVAGLVYMIVCTKTFPTLSILIAGSFALYGAVKKQLEVSAQASLFMETFFMTPIALGFIAFAQAESMTGAVGLTPLQTVLLPACGVVTVIPLLLFNLGVKKIPYYASGILMYINPTLQFFMGIFYFREEMDINRLIAFVVIWVGIAFTVFDKIKKMKNPEKR